jgi:alcohol dehydrogenase class IV
MKYELYMPTKVICGEDALEYFSTLETDKKVLIVCDRVMKEIGFVNEVREALGGRDAVVFSEVEPNPTLQNVEAAVKIARDFNSDFIIGLGGGSSMDTAKLTSYIAKSGGKAGDYLYGRIAMDQERFPLVLIPTTTGTGSECTAVGVYSDTANNRKLNLIHPKLRADVALLVPRFTYSQPPRVTAASGIDAFTHCLESYWNINSYAATEAMAMMGCKLVLENLYSCYKNPQDAAGRYNMVQASFLGGFSFGQTKTTAIHGLSFPLADAYHIEHGVTCALTLVPFIQYVYPSASEKMDQLIVFCGYKNIQHFTAAIIDLLQKLDLPTTLSSVGGKQADIWSIAETAIKFPITHMMPRTITLDEMIAILNSIL